MEEAVLEFTRALLEDPDRPGNTELLSNIGIFWNSQYKRTGKLQYLEHAVTVAEAAVLATPEGHPNRAGLLNNLGNHLSTRYERTGNLEDLEAAIGQSEAAVLATPEDHRDRARWLSNLGNHLGSRYQRTRNLEDLEAAIAQSEAAVLAIPENCPELATLLSNLGIHLSRRYERTGNLEDLEAAIAQSEAAVLATPEDHPDRARWLNNLGNHLSSRYIQTGNVQNLEAAIAAQFASWGISTAPISIRLGAAITVSKILVFNPLVQDLPRACSLLHDAIHLMPLATSRSLDRDDQQQILRQFTGLSSFAAAVSLEAKQSPFMALRLLELGRSITNSQLLDYRSDISDLIDQHPTLAKDFHSLCLELDTPFHSTALVSLNDSTGARLDSTAKRLQMQQNTIRRRLEVAQDLNNILQEIRQKPGFKNFLLAESEEYFLSAAQEGPIVLLNVTDLRSDAILLTQAKVTSIALPHISHASMVKYSNTSNATSNEVTREFLEWLWKAAIQPVLRELGFYPPKEADPLPRIWWIGVGLMAKAPIHAAAKFKNGRVRMTTLQYCIPSYTSTIRALQYSRSRQCQRNASMLIVTMPETPGACALSDVTKEADEIKRNFSIVDILKRPTAERVLQALPNYSLTHFACHGVSSTNPADSHLVLLKESHDGTEEVDKLRVKDVAALNLPAARLAYLSACSTANTSADLIDEVTHIVSSFHIAGFAYVIGTLWPAEDEACYKMAADFYPMLIISKTDNVALSYRNAILRLMEQKPTQPMYWAPFIHFGA